MINSIILICGVRIGFPMCIAFHLSTVNFICHLIAQSLRLIRFLCRFIWLLLALAILNSSVSSSNFLNSLFTYFPKSLMNTVTIPVARLDPTGTSRVKHTPLQKLLIHFSSVSSPLNSFLYMWGPFPLSHHGSAFL